MARSTEPIEARAGVIARIGQVQRGLGGVQLLALGVLGAGLRGLEGDRLLGSGLVYGLGGTGDSMKDSTVAAQPYDIWHFQDPLFVIDSFDQLAAAFDQWVAQTIR